MHRRHWLAVVTRENLDVIAANQYQFTGVPARRQAAARRLSPGDLVVFYLAGASRFVAVAEIASQAYWEDTLVWESGVYPVRFKMRPLDVLRPEDGPHIRMLLPRLKFVEGARDWRGLVRTALREISPADFRVLHEAIKEAKRG